MDLFKKCCCCKKQMPVNEFWKSSTTKDGLQGYCKNCCRIRTRAYRENNPEKVKVYTKNYWNKYNNKLIEKYKMRRDKRQIFLDTLKTPCVKCGESRIWVIQFHHIDPNLKSFALAEGKKYHKSKEDVINESKKCVCLCANCHKEFHYFYGIKPINPVNSLNEYLNGGIEYGAV
ncbi:MAG: hypothetical protein MSS83_05580 [Methanobrevibacter sp.]|uniref:hypothetical protein n=1 Tax=Methanobrevibacter sp. TaxID=66852 RepID=UPI0031F53EA8|nr:hypothetical protein [Methanobrevibacter sp.]